MNGITPGQAMRLGGVVADSLLSSSLDKASAQKILGDQKAVEKIKETVPHIVEALITGEGANVIIPVFNAFKHERSKARGWSYPREFKPLGPREQVQLIKSILSKNGYDPNLNSSWVPDLIEKAEKEPEADFIQVWPKLAVIAEKIGAKLPYGSDYGLCLRLVFNCLERSRPLFEVKTAPVVERISLLPDISYDILKMEEDTPGDFMVKPIQSGRRYAGYSARNARWEVEHTDQWILDPYVVAWHLLTHPQRIVDYDHLSLSIDCYGSIGTSQGSPPNGKPQAFAFDAIGHDNGAVGIWFHSAKEDLPSEHYGLASGIGRIHRR